MAFPRDRQSCAGTPSPVPPVVRRRAQALVPGPTAMTPPGARGPAAFAHRDASSELSGRSPCGGRGEAAPDNLARPGIVDRADARLAAFQRLRLRYRRDARAQSRREAIAFERAVDEHAVDSGRLNARARDRRLHFEGDDERYHGQAGARDYILRWTAHQSVLSCPTPPRPMPTRTSRNKRAHAGAVPRGTSLAQQSGNRLPPRRSVGSCAPTRARNNSARPSYLGRIRPGRQEPNGAPRISHAAGRPLPPPRARPASLGVVGIAVGYALGFLRRARKVRNHSGDGGRSTGAARDGL